MCLKNHSTWMESSYIRLSSNVFPFQVAAFGALCLLSLFFYLRKDCNRNRRIRIFMITISVADTILIQMFVLIYIGLFNNVCKAPDGDTYMKAVYTNYSHIIFFVANMSMAVSTWSITMMLFDHLVGIKNPFWKQAQNRPVRTSYLTVFLIVLCSFVVTVHYVFKRETSQSLTRDQCWWALRVLNTLNILYMFLLPTVSMFVYIYLISYHIHQSQKIFSNRNEVCHAVTRSSSTDGLRVHRGRRSNDSQRKVKIIPKMLVFIAINFLFTSLPSVFLALKTYVTGNVTCSGNKYDQNFFELFFVSNFCLISGKIVFYLIVIVSQAARFWAFTGYICFWQLNPVHLIHNKNQQSAEDHQNISKTSTIRSDSTTTFPEKYLVTMSRAHSTFIKKSQRPLIKEQFEMHHQSNVETNSTHSFNIEKVSRTDIFQ